MKNEEKIELLYNEEYLPKEKEQKRTVLLSKVSPKIENFIEKNIKSILYLDIISIMVLYMFFMSILEEEKIALRKTKNKEE